MSEAASDADALMHPKVRETFSALLAAFNKKAGGSSGRFARLILMDDPPSLDSGELTDKGSINQRAVLALRAEMVEELYAETPSARTITVDAVGDRVRRPDSRGRMVRLPRADARGRKSHRLPPRANGEGDRASAIAGAKGRPMARWCEAAIAVARQMLQRRTP